ncbi:hypothetical protein MRS44_017113 [Fusarium solani]|uniref:uncharacterized protein n=1 Tax=Fusarium solani TaxID=169388 RepID=UPI0032C4743B|nr:hypothetical protein MRS44_017113 [Fusarium solani]
MEGLDSNNDPLVVQLWLSARPGSVDVSRGSGLAARLAGALLREELPCLGAKEWRGSAELAIPLVGTTLTLGSTADRHILEKVEMAPGQLPKLNADGENNDETDGEGPLPGDAPALEEPGVEKGNVDDGDDGETPSDDPPG